jgi:hypothetical protein
LDPKGLFTEVAEICDLDLAALSAEALVRAEKTIGIIIM